VKPKSREVLMQRQSLVLGGLHREYSLERAA
jgi:hypothetical protein